MDNIIRSVSRVARGVVSRAEAPSSTKRPCIESWYEIVSSSPDCLSPVRHVCRALQGWKENQETETGGGRKTGGDGCSRRG